MEDVPYMRPVSQGANAGRRSDPFNNPTLRSPGDAGWGTRNINHRRPMGDPYLCHTTAPPQQNQICSIRLIRKICSLKSPKISLIRLIRRQKFRRHANVLTFVQSTDYLCTVLNNKLKIKMKNQTSVPDSKCRGDACVARVSPIKPRQMHSRPMPRVNVR